jgi:hypothetical protein
VDLTLVPEVEARNALVGRSLHMTVLAPVGNWLGVGVLRVLRTTERDDCIDLVCGYESYDRPD